MDTYGIGELGNRGPAEEIIEGSLRKSVQNVGGGAESFVWDCTRLRLVIVNREGTATVCWYFGGEDSGAEKKRGAELSGGRRSALFF